MWSSDLHFYKMTGQLMGDGLEGGSWEDIGVSGDRRWQLGWGRWPQSLLPVCTCYLPCGGGEGVGESYLGV